MSDLFLGIDSGTQGTKVVAVDAEKKATIAEGYAPHRLFEDNSGMREQDPAWWLAAAEEAIGMVLSGNNARAADVRAIGVSGQQHGMVALDADGQVIRPAKLWCDTATTKQAETITEKLGGNEAVSRLIGNSIAVGFTASKVLWLKENEPDRYERVRTILLPHDYINYWLTGVLACEPGDASGTAYFDVRRRDWSSAVLQAIDASGKLADCLPRLIDSGEPVGTVRRSLADRFGLSSNVVVSSGGGDNMMAAIGTGNVAPGVITASLGTSGTIYAFSARPVVDTQGELAAFCSSDGNWLPLACTMNVTVATETMRSLLGLDLDGLNEKAGSVPIGSNGVMLLPYFNGERTPALPRAHASLHGLNTRNLTAENLTRASMEGATFGLRYALDVLRRNQIAPREIRLVGGGSRSPLWRRIVADVLGYPVVCPLSSEAGALGAAIQAMWCYRRQREPAVFLPALTADFVRLNETSRLEPVADNMKQYTDLYQHYLRLNAAMQPMNQ